MILKLKKNNFFFTFPPPSYCSPYYWSAFECVGFDGELDLREIKAAMLDQSIDKIESAFLRDNENGSKKECLNVKTVVEKNGITTRESFLTQLQQNLSLIFRDAVKKPQLFDHLIHLVETAESMVDKGPKDSFDAQFQARRCDGSGGREYDDADASRYNNNKRQTTTSVTQLTTSDQLKTIKDNSVK